MDILLQVLIVVAVAALILSLLFYKKKKTYLLPAFPAVWREILSRDVEFYNHLSVEKKKEFEERAQRFLTKVKITGVNTTVDDTDKVFIASSAIIPIFGFPNWEYINLNEVLLYPDAFNDEFAQQGGGRDTLGMVGTGSLEDVMILSKHELQQGFLNKTGKTNTAIHEFVHLVDKTDGTVDGIPEMILSRQYILPWLDLMQREIKKITSDRSDINPYGATDKAEFFAVVAEYFFERPELFEKKHPELFKLMSIIFRKPPS